jgi:hypothetical protein
MSRLLDSNGPASGLMFRKDVAEGGPSGPLRVDWIPPSLRRTFLSWENIGRFCTSGCT